MSYFFIKFNGGHFKIKHSEMIYVEGRKNYVTIYMKGKKHLVHYTMKQVEEQLPPESFCRIHKSYIVALDQLQSFNRECVCLENGTQLPLSPPYYEVLKSKLTIMGDQKKVKHSEAIFINGNAVLKNKES